MFKAHLGELSPDKAVGLGSHKRLQEAKVKVHRRPPFSAIQVEAWIHCYGISAVINHDPFSNAALSHFQSSIHIAPVIHLPSPESTSDDIEPGPGGRP